MSSHHRYLAQGLVTARRSARFVLGVADITNPWWFATCPTPSSSRLRWRRLFHSHEHPATSDSFGSAERLLLASAYARVPEHGFSAAALTNGARDAGYPDISASLMPDGAFRLILYHLTRRRRDLTDRRSDILDLNEQGSGELSVAERVERLSWERLMGNKDVIHKWQEALAVMAQPSYARASMKELASLSDDICYLASDTPVDMTWYTKRATLSIIYASSELFMTNDYSANFGDTRQFLRRRLNEVSGLGGIVGSLGQWIGFTAASSINVLRSKGLYV